MKILHIAPLSPYNLNWSYQENLLPKYQRKLGHEVCVVVSNYENQKNGKVDVGESDFYLNDGIHVFRRKRFLDHLFLGKFISFTNIKDILNDYKPDFVMIHSIMTLSVFQVIRYKKKFNHKCIIIQDNHLDENIGKKKNKILTNLFYAYWKMINKFAQNSVTKYYGVTPWRQEFIIKRFGIPKEKTDLLIMGADLDGVSLNKKNEYRKELKSKYNIHNEFIIVTGGKIERNKNIALLMEAVKKINNVKLLVFGQIADEYKKNVMNAMSDNTVMIGWLNNIAINKLFIASDLAVFPGQHSVLWEQACACKIPCLFAHWSHMEHLNNGGNSDEIFDISIDGITQKILEYKNTPKYKTMLDKAQSNITNIYRYDIIAKKSLECAKGEENEK